MKCNSKFLSRLTLCVFLSALCSALASAQGIMVSRLNSRNTPFLVKSVNVDSEISDGLAQVTVKQVFQNSSSVDQEGTYLFPLPDGATVSSFSLTAGDKVLEGKLLTREEARGIYEEIVRRKKDPALLEYMGQGLFRAHVFPIPPHSDRTLTLRYSEVIKPEGTMRKFVYPLSTGKYSSFPISSTNINVRLKSKSPLKTVYSLTHDVSIRRPDDHTATASWETKNQFPDRDFVVYYASSQDDIGLNMLVQPTSSEGGYFMLIATPKLHVSREKAAPKQIVFVLDRTGSMLENNKIGQAKGAMRFCLNSLNPNDQFDVITFNESPDLLSSHLMPARKENIDKALRFVDAVDASGGTNIAEALKSALTVLKSNDGRQKMVVFITDGLPTVGETNIDRILEKVKLDNAKAIASANKIPYITGAVNARIFCFGLGYDVNVPFLDRLAEQNRAESDYVRPSENVEGIVSSFFGKITSPALSDLTLKAQGAELYDVYPKHLPDMFTGSQLVITGRYRGGDGSVQLSGYSNDRQTELKVMNAFGENASQNSNLSRIWATRKIGFLLDEVRLHSNKEVIDEVIRLSKVFGIITPYTSFLADETGRLNVMRDGNSLSYSIDSLSTSAKSSLFALSDRAKNDVGAAATGRALNSRGYQNAGQLPAQNQGGFGGGGLGGGGFGGGRGKGGSNDSDYFDANVRLLDTMSRSAVAGRYGDVSQGLGGKLSLIEQKAGHQQISAASSVQNVAGRTFYKKADVWIDNNYVSKQSVLKIVALSDAHFQLMKLHPEVAKYGVVGEEVVIQFHNQAVQIGKTGSEKLTETQLTQLR